MSGSLELLAHFDGEAALALAGDPCGLPVPQQAERLERKLSEQGIRDLTIAITDMYGLPDVERDLAVDALCEGLDSPFVLLDGRRVCTGSVDVSAVLDALGTPVAEGA